MKNERWNGYPAERFTLNGRSVLLVSPRVAPNGRWAIKSEYFDAFPAVQLALLEQGYHIAYIENQTRWHVWADTDARAALARYLHEEKGLAEKGVLIGMSCGGMQGIYFGAKYPQYVSCLYLDAPVVNLLSCPACMGRATEGGMMEEFEAAKGMDRFALLAYRDHPLDHLPALVQNRVPVVLVAGDSDRTVSFEENGLLLQKAYEAAAAPLLAIVKPGCDHHPHSLEDNTPILDFIRKYDHD